MEGRGSVGEGEEDMKCPNCGACTTGNYCITDSIIQQTRVDCPDCGEVVLYRWPDNGEWTMSVTSKLLHVMSVLHGGELVVVNPRGQPNQIVVQPQGGVGVTDGIVE